jgi:hypothetical protein
LNGGLACFPRFTFLQMLDHASNRVETLAADRPSTWNACHLLHLLGHSTKQTVLRFPMELLFKDIDAKVHTLFANIYLWPRYEFSHLVLCLVAKRAPQNPEWAFL